MAYEYENETKNLITKLSGVWVESEKKEILKELQEVYRKAKAWDNYISEVRERVRFTENTEDDIENETQKVIDYYMEDE